MVSPWMANGNAIDYVRNNPTTDRLRLLAQAAEGLRYLHNFKPSIVHGDVRGVNVFISDSGEACVADIGLLYVDESGATSYANQSKHEGNWAWTAPELLNEDIGSSSSLTDVFSFGRMIFELTTGRRPFYELPRSAVFNAVIRGTKPERPKGALELTDAMWGLVEECCHSFPDRRPQMDVVVARIWDAQSSSRLSTMV